MKLKEVCSCGAMIEAEDTNGNGDYSFKVIERWRTDHQHDTTVASPVEPLPETCVGCGGELPGTYEGILGAKFCSDACLNRLHYALRDDYANRPSRTRMFVVNESLDKS